jgi:hypothetical protein
MHMGKILIYLGLLIEYYFLYQLIFSESQNTFVKIKTFNSKYFKYKSNTYQYVFDIT